MSQHHARLVWPLPAGPADAPPFTYATYSRDHALAFGTGRSMEASAASEYRGSPGLPNPEELLVAALSSCHMLTFLAIAARKGLPVTGYTDDAVGTLTKDERGQLSVTEVLLRPRVTFGVDVGAATLASLHEAAHHGCFIANSVRTNVRVLAETGAVGP